MKDNRGKLRIVLTLIILFVCCTCYPKPGEYTMTNEDINSTATSVLITATQIPSSTIRLSQTATVELMPTLSSTQASQYVLKMLTTNGNCDYPCWWGIVPGEMSWRQAKYLLSPVTISITGFPKGSGNISYWVNIPDPENQDKQLTAVFYVDNSGIVDVMAVPINKGELQEFLRKYGIPNEIWVHFMGQFPGATSEYIIAFFYREKGMMLMTGGSGETVIRNNIKFLKMCSIEFSAYHSILLWKPYPEKSFYDIAFDLGITHPEEPGFGRVNNVTNMDEKSFYNQMLSDTNICLETPYDKWPINSPSQ